VSGWKSLKWIPKLGPHGAAMATGRHLFQLPWMMAVQNNATAAVNNLRRLGARGNEARDETERIEARLGMLFEQRGFRVLVGHEFPADIGDEETRAIDLLCALEGHLLMLELKSTYERRSMNDAWMHHTSTLRKAGWQLHRKVPAVRHALLHEASLRRTLALPEAEPALNIGGHERRCLHPIPQLSPASLATHQSPYP
jgi:hypothetical protein